MPFTLEYSQQPFRKRIEWILWEPPEKERFAQNELVQRSDYIRQIAIPKYHKHKLDLHTQWRLLHRWHLYRNEHLVLSAEQADLLLQCAPSLDRIGGVLRSSDTLPINVMIGSGTGIGVAHEMVKPLYTKLTQTAESLFPVDGINSTINKDTIYPYLSLIQYAYALTHPFYEGVGRTSEETLYTLWLRRPDLKDTIHFLSSTGHRNNSSVFKHMSIINDSLSELNKQIGIEWGLEGDDFSIFPTKKNCTSIKLLSALERHNPQNFASIHDYETEYFNKMASYVDTLISNPEVTIGLPVIDNLAQNLANASDNYYLHDKNMLKW